MPEQSAIPVLITRPQPQADRFAAELPRHRGLRPVISPLMRTAFLTPPVPEGPFAAMVLTSSTGAEAAGRLQEQSLTLPKRALCVGDGTAAAARELGFEAISAQGDAQALAALIRAQPPGDLLWLRGQHVAARLAVLVPDRAIAQAVVYEQQPCPPTEEALDLLAQPGRIILPVFSRRSAQLVADLLPAEIQAEVATVAISAKAAQPLPPALHRIVILAESPESPAMIRAILSLLP